VDVLDHWCECVSLVIRHTHSKTKQREKRRDRNATDDNDDAAHNNNNNTRGGHVTHTPQGE
jgi:hypothetical protein